MNPRSRRIIVTGVLLVLVLLVVVGALWQTARAHAAPSAAPQAPVFTISDDRITENSGMARDTGRQLFWVANDSGDRGIVYAVGINGKTIGTLEYAAKPLDVEAVAMHDGRLMVADIGDNQANRKSVTVYYFDKPAPNDDRSGTFRSWEFTYPDGPHDAETLLVDGTGRLYIVTKEAEAGVYAAPRQPRSSGTNQLTRVADAPAFVTDGTFLPDGRIALRTYASLEILDGKLFSPQARAPLPFQPQGESLTMSLDNKTLLIGSEGSHMPVWRVPVPAQLLDVAPGQPTPPASPSPTPTPTPAATSESAVTPANDRRGTLIALLLALVASLVAAAVVWFRGRRRDAPAPPPGAAKPAPGSPARPVRSVPVAPASQPTPPRDPGAPREPRPRRALVDPDDRGGAPPDYLFRDE